MKRANLFILLLGIMILLPGCDKEKQSIDDAINNDKTYMKNNENQQDNTPIGEINNYKTDEELEKIILKAANIPSNANIIFSIKRDYNENGVTYYIFNFIYNEKEYNYTINPVDGNILSPTDKILLPK